MAKTSAKRQRRLREIAVPQKQAGMIEQAIAAGRCHKKKRRSEIAARSLQLI